MATIRTTFKFTCDLDRGTTEVNLRNPLMQSDAFADEFAVSITRNGNPVDVSNMTVYAYLYTAATQKTILFDGSSSGNTASVVLQPFCYAEPGFSSISVQIAEGDILHTVLKVNFSVSKTGTDYVIDGDNVLPGLQELLGQIAAMEQATDAANEAAAAADAARDGIQGDLAALSEEIENLAESNCVNYLGIPDDVAETIKSGVTYSCTDGVFSLSGTATSAFIVRLLDSPNALPAWWKPGKTLRIIYQKSDNDSRLYFRIYKYTAGGDVTQVYQTRWAVTETFTIPEDFDGVGLQIRLHILSGDTVDTTAAVKIFNTLPYDEIVDTVQDARNPLDITMVAGSYIRGETGLEVANADLSASEPIDVSAYVGMPLLIRCRIASVMGFAFYSSLPCSKNTFVSGVDGTMAGVSGKLVDYVTTVPENAAYLRITATVDTADGCFVIPQPTIGLLNKNMHSNGARIHNRNIAMFGDSIMLGRDGNDEGEMVILSDNIPAIVGKMLSVNTTNYGVGGMGWLTEASNMIAYDKIASVDLTDYDTVTLCFGVNDHSQPLGETWDTKDEATCMGQFHKCIEYIYQQNPTCRVVIIGPFNGRNVGTFPDYWYGNTTWKKLDEMLKQACDYYWIPYISQKDGPINAFTIQTLIGEDGVHPSQEGYQRLGEWIAGELRRLIG